MLYPIHSKLGEDRRVAIPAKVCARLGIAPGDPLVLEEDGESLRLIPFARLLQYIQATFAPYRIEGHSEVDELIAERRAEAAQDDSRG
jgi:AbrB family looped-hinge helix DNA binding protein